MDVAIEAVSVIVFVLAVTVIAFSVAGCSTTNGETRSVDLLVKGSYSPGSAQGTRNQNPQGGTDEKSDSTPVESTR